MWLTEFAQLAKHFFAKGTRLRYGGPALIQGVAEEYSKLSRPRADSSRNPESFLWYAPNRQFDQALTPPPPPPPPGYAPTGL